MKTNGYLKEADLTLAAPSQQTELPASVEDAL